VWVEVYIRDCGGPCKRCLRAVRWGPGAERFVWPSGPEGKVAMQCEKDEARDTDGRTTRLKIEQSNERSQMKESKKRSRGGARKREPRAHVASPK
jgi:hypothetical protein